jgi:dihydroorotate dehydrogenase
LIKSTIFGTKMIYRFIIRPILFLFDPESVHYFVVRVLKYSCGIPGVSKLMNFCFSLNDKALERIVFGIKFNNPVGLAAGFDKNAEIYNELSGFGFSFIEIGTVTPEPQPGNRLPRSFRLPGDKALINRMGINNVGAAEIARRLKKNQPDVIIGGNIGKNTTTLNSKAIDDYVKCFEVLYEAVDYFVLNVSCPNIGDIKGLQDAGALLETLGFLKRLSDEKPVQKPILLKISPDLNFLQLDELVEIAFKTGIAGFVATNTTIKREGLSTRTERIEEIGNGGLSGQPLRDRSTEVIRYLVDKSGGKIPVIGVGGIMNPEDAIEKLNAGASLVQLYTGFIYEGPSIAKRINKAIVRHLPV